MRGSKSWKPWAAAGAVVALLVVAVVVTLVPLGGENGLPAAANTGQVTGFLVAVGTAVVTAVVWAWRTTRPRAATPVNGLLEQAKDVLAGEVAEQWEHEARLRFLADPDPIPVLWRTPAQPPRAATALMDHRVNIDSAGQAEWTASSADIGSLANRFRRTRRRRLVILGGPGAGKTTLAVQLLLHLLATRRQHPDEPVPVLLPVAGWDTGKFPRLHEWLADRLATDYPALRSAELGVDVARALAMRGCVLPILDGLDELSPGAQAKVIIALNRSLGGDDQLILTSRTTEFTDAVSAAGDVVTSAAVLESLPLDPAAAADFLAHCLPPSPGRGWEQVLTTLRNTPSADQAQPGPAADGPGAALADIASTPLGLWLLRTVYTAPGANPAELTDPARFPAAVTLRDHLYDQLIPAVIATRPPSGNSAEPFRPRRRRDPGDTRRWLGYLAYRLTHPTTPDGAPRTSDFRWWHLVHNGLAEPPAIKLLSGFISGGIGGVVGGLIGGPPYALTLGLLMGITSVVMGGYSVNSWSRDKPGFVNLRLRGRTRELAGHLAFGLGIWFPFLFAFGLLIGKFEVGLAFGLAFGIAFGLARGLTMGLSRWMEVPAVTAAAGTPLSSWRADRFLNLVRILTLGLVYGLAFGVVGGIRYGATAGLVLGLAAVLPFGFVAGTGIGTGVHRAWVTYLIVTRHLARRRLLPRDLMRFLDDAHRLGLLRAVGPVYQFRHSELQEHLAAAYQSRPRPSADLSHQWVVAPGALRLPGVNRGRPGSP